MERTEAGETTRGDAPSLALANRAVTLALQGGASYGAYTWGVLDRLLEDPALEIEGVTGGSAGAINAVVLADGLAAAGREGARASLRRFWEELAAAARSRRRTRVGDLRSLLGSLSGRSSIAVLHFFTTRLAADFRMSSRSMEPLRSTLDATIDFERVRRASPIEVFVNATNCRTREIRIFARREITPEAVCASACIPLLFEAVQIDGEHYWDGGFLGNPAIFPVIYGCRASDVILVETRPPASPRPPATAAELLARVVDVSSTASLVRELRMIDFVSKLVRSSQGSLPEGVREIRVHRVKAPPALDELEGASAFRADLPYFRSLHAIGRESAQRWIEELGGDAACHRPAHPVEAPRCTRP